VVHDQLCNAVRGPKRRFEERLTFLTYLLMVTNGVRTHSRSGYHLISLGLIKPDLDSF